MIHRRETLVLIICARTNYIFRLSPMTSQCGSVMYVRQSVHFPFFGLLSYYLTDGLDTSHNDTRHCSAQYYYYWFFDFRSCDPKMRLKIKKLNHLFLIIEHMDFELHGMILDWHLHNYQFSQFPVMWFRIVQKNEKFISYMIHFPLKYSWKESQMKMRKKNRHSF